MKAGDVIRWKWYIRLDWEPDLFYGTIVDTRLKRSETGHRIYKMLKVLMTDGAIIELNSDNEKYEIEKINGP
tara:strand:+ start:439 stop:654 length:216 start_codon:yes stop_codon:yes gene_type:complete